MTDEPRTEESSEVGAAAGDQQFEGNSPVGLQSTSLPLATREAELDRGQQTDEPAHLKDGEVTDDLALAQASGVLKKLSLTPPAVGGAVHEADDSPSATDSGWRGHNLEPFSVGEPGRAFTEVVASIPTHPWSRPDTIIDGGLCNDLVIRAVSVRGQSKRYFNKTRQDEYGLGTDASGRWLLAAVADGVSEGGLSHEAARAASTIALRRLAEQLQDTTPDAIDWTTVYRAVVSAIMRRAEREFPSPSSHSMVDAARVMATTLTMAICDSQPQNNQWRSYISWVGDSPAWVRRNSGSWECATEIKGAGQEIASSSVAALPVVPKDGLNTNTVNLELGEALFLMSDGVGDPLGDGNGPVKDFLESQWQTAPDALSFAGHVSFGRRGFDDDRTVVGIWSVAGKA